ncbi:MAG: DNA polymerase III subunit gamma/tau [Patescibacteria group bacterium]
MSTLYRKYRPQTFKDLIGQNHIKITLQHELELYQIGHAYLFCGPRGLGKTSAARLFAKAVNCQNIKEGESEPCNVCESCLAITSSRALDIIEIDAASHTGVDQVRENIIENVRFTPSGSKYKVFIIDEVHMLSISAFNALLKTLEEPPAHAIFILCTTEIHKVPQTIISRCQRFDFRKVSKADLLKRLKYIVKAENKQVADKVLENIIIYSEGCVRDAESLLGKILTLGDDISEEMAEIVLPHSDFSLIVSFLDFILEKNTTGAIELINKLVTDGVDLQIFTDSLVEFLRKVLLLKAGGSLGEFGIELDEATEAAAARLAERFDYAKLLSVIELFLAKKQELKTAFIQQLPLETAAVQLSEEVICRRDDDSENKDSGAGGCPEGFKKEKQEDKEAAEKKIKEKIKDRLARFSHLKSKEAAPETAESQAASDQPESKTDENQKIVSFEEITESWQKIIEVLLKKNYTLGSLLKISRPLECQDNILEIGLKSKFYKDRLEDLKNKKLIGDVVSEVVAAAVVVRGVIKEDVEPLMAGQQSGPAAGAEALDAKIESAAISIEPIKIQKSGDVAQEVIAMF